MSSVALKPASCQVRDIYIQSGSEVFDLHNDFDFVGFTYDTAQRTVCLRWVPNKHASAKQHHALVLEMGGVSFLSSTPRDSDVPFSEDSCLHQIGRIPPSAPTLIPLNQMRLPIGTIFFLSCRASCCALPQSQCV
jgi:hypothetical protein